MPPSVSYLNINSDSRLAYQQLPGKTPGIIFCSGFMADMQGIKALALEDFCRAEGYAFVRFDYRGHGQSSGDIQKANISAWLADALAILDKVTQGPQLIIGSSMGAWIATLVTNARPNRIAGLIGVAAAPDFTENLIWAKLPTEMQEQLWREEILYFPIIRNAKPYPITRQLIEDGRKNLILSTALSIQCPVRLLHGLEDIDVPWQNSLQLAEKLQAEEINLTLIKGGEHRLARAQDLAILQQTIKQLL